MRDKGGEIIKKVIRDGVEAVIFAHGVPILRLRSADKFPRIVRRVADENELTVSEWANRLHELRGLAYLGVPVIIKYGKGSTFRVLATRHKEARFELIEHAVRVKVEREQDERVQEMAEAIKRQEAIVVALAARLDEANDQLREILEALEARPSGSLEDWQVKLLARLRKKEGEAAWRANLARPMAKDLDGFHED